MNTDKPKDGQPELPPHYDQLLTRIVRRREEIRQRQDTLSDSAELIREERDRRLENVDLP
jgi:hypothetical protein